MRLRWEWDHGASPIVFYSVGSSQLDEYHEHSDWCLEIIKPLRYYFAWQSLDSDNKPLGAFWAFGKGMRKYFNCVKTWALSITSLKAFVIGYTFMHVGLRCKDPQIAAQAQLAYQPKKLWRNLRWSHAGSFACGRLERGIEVTACRVLVFGCIRSWLSLRQEFLILWHWSLIAWFKTFYKILDGVNRFSLSY